MDDLRRELAALRGRVRLQMVVMMGLLTTMLFALGGADVVARALVESDAWRVKTKKADLVNFADRIIATTDVDKGQVKINDANLVMTGSTAATTGNIVLAQQSSDPQGLAEGALAYNSTSKKLKYFNGNGWVESGGGGLELIETKRLTTNQSSVVFNGLNGDADEVYVIVAQFVNRGGAAALYHLRPNGIASNQTGAYSNNSNSGEGATAGVSALVIGRADLGQNPGYGLSEITFYAKSSIRRHCTGTYFATWSTSTGILTGHIAGQWRDDSTVINSLEIVSSIPNAIGSGSVISLYRL